MGNWILFSQREPEKTKNDFYEILVETDTDNFGKLCHADLYFWDGDRWNLCYGYPLVETDRLSFDYFKINTPIKWKEFRALNLVE